MPFILSPMKEEDIPSFGVVDEEAMKGWGFAEGKL